MAQSPYLTLKCWSCAATFDTANDLSTHHLDTHERPLPVLYEQGWHEWHAVPTLPGFTPPNWKAQAAQAWTTNGGHI